MVKHFSKPHSYQEILFLRWWITNELWILSVSYTFMNDSSVIDHFWKFISRKLLSFEKWFTTHFLPLGHRKKMSAFLFPFSTLLVKIFHAEHLGRFFNDHPLVRYKVEIWKKHFCIFISIFYTFGENLSCWTFSEVF